MTEPITGLLLVYLKHIVHVVEVIIALDKMGYQLIFFLFLHENICCGYSLEVPQRGTSNEYLQHIIMEN